MQFYIQSLCKYKKQKRIYYEFVDNLNDYIDIADNIIAIISKYNLPSSMGILYLSKKDY